MNLEKLKELAEKLPEESNRANAIALVERMGEVIEGISDKPITWRPGTLKLTQATSDRSKLPRGATVGDLVLGETVLDKPYKVIPIRSWDARQYWSPDQNEAKMLCSSPDAEVGYLGFNCRECPHSEFKDNKIDCNKIKVFMVVASDLSDVFLVNFAKTSYKVGGDWQGLMKKAGVAPYRRVYGITSESSKQYKNVETMSIETFRNEDKDTPKEMLEFVTELFNQVGADRKETVDAFHKMILARRQDPSLMLANNSGVDSEVQLIEASKESAPADSAETATTGDDNITTVEIKSPAKTKRYTVD